MPRPVMTYELAMAAGADAADRRMRAARRSTWTVEDWDLAAATVARLLAALAETEKKDV